MEISQFYNTFQSASAALEKLSGRARGGARRPRARVDPVPLGDAARRAAIRRRPVRLRRRIAACCPTSTSTVPAGQTLALVGTTGAGKTTLAKLATRFYDPTGGRVLLDGVDLRDLASDDLRRAVVMVTQENYLFSGHRRRQHPLRPPGRDDRARSSAAARPLGAHEFIARCPRATTPTSPTGAAGSAPGSGSSSRSPARSSPTRRCSSSTRRRRRSTSRPSGSCSRRCAPSSPTAPRSIIAHRLSTVEIADRVLVMEHGRIVEDGAPSDLVAGGGRSLLRPAPRLGRLARLTRPQQVARAVRRPSTSKSSSSRRDELLFDRGC